MAQRFLEIDISRSIFTSVNVVIDDEDPKYAGLFDASGKVSNFGWSALKDVAHKAADKIVSEYDWETDKSETEIDGYKEVSEEEAKLFSVWDEKNNRKLEG
jgi:hypothetical protein